MAKVRTQIEINASKAQRDLQELTKRLGAADKTVKELTKAYNEQQAELTEINRIYKKKLGFEMEGKRLGHEDARRLRTHTKLQRQLNKDIADHLRVAKAVAAEKKRAQALADREARNLERETRQRERAAAALEKQRKKTALLTDVTKKFSQVWRVMIASFIAQRLVDVSLAAALTAEKIDLLSKKIQTLTKDADGLEKVVAKANEVGVSFDELGKVVGRFAVATKNAYSVDTMLKWTEGLVKSARLVGTSQQEMQSGMIQISQAMSAGRLMGDEFRSVMENLPLLAVELREEFKNVNTPLKELASQGAITEDVLVRAFERLNEKMANVPGLTDTVSADLSRLENAWAQMLNTMSNSTGGFVQSTIQVLTGMINSINEFWQAGDKIALAEALSGELDKSEKELKEWKDKLVKLIEEGDKSFRVRNAELEIERLTKIVSDYRRVVDVYDAKKKAQDELNHAKAIQNRENALTDLGKAQDFVNKSAAEGNEVLKITMEYDAKIAQLKKNLLSFNEKHLKQEEDGGKIVQLKITTENEILRLQEEKIKKIKELTNAEDDQAKNAIKAQKEHEQYIKGWAAKFEKWSKEIEKNKKEEIKWNNMVLASESKVKNENIDRLEELNKWYDELKLKFSPLAVATENYETQLRLLAIAQENSGLSAEEHEAALKKINQTMLKAQAEAGNLAAKLELEWNKLSDSLEDNFSNFFDDLFMDTENAWDNLADSMENTFKQMLANMVKEYAKQKIFQPMFDGLMGGGTSGSGGGIFGSVAQSAIGSAIKDYIGLDLAGIGGVGYGTSLLTGVGSSTGAYSATTLANFSIGNTASQAAGSQLVGTVAPYLAFALPIAAWLMESGKKSPTDFNLGFGTPTDYFITPDGTRIPVDALGSSQYKNIAIANSYQDPFGGDIYSGTGDGRFTSTFGRDYSGINPNKGFSFLTPFGMGGFEIQDTGKEGQMSDAEAQEFVKGVKSYLTAISAMDLLIIDTFKMSEQTIMEITNSLNTFTKSGTFEGAQDAILDRFSHILKDTGIGGAFDSLEGKTEDIVGVLSSYLTVSEGLKDLYAELYNAGERNAESMLNQISTISSVNAMFEKLGVSTYELSIAGIEASQNLVDAAGGMENLSTLTSNFFNAFYDDQEKLEDQTQAYAKAVKKLNEAYGTAISTSTDAYKDEVKALLESADASDDLKVAMLGLTPTVVSVDNAVESLANTAADVARKLMTEANSLLSVAAKFGNADLANLAYQNFWKQEIADKNALLSSLGLSQLTDLGSFEAIQANVNKITAEAGQKGIFQDIGMKGTLGVFDWITEFLKAAEDYYDATISKAPDEIKQTADSVSELTKEIDDLDLSLGQTLINIQNLRRSILRDKMSFGFKPNFQGQIDFLNTQLTGSESDVAIYDKIRQATVDKYNAEIQGIRDSNQARLEQLQAEQGYFQSIKDYARDLRVSELSPFLHPQRTQEAGQNFFALANAARGSGPEALNALSQLQGSAQTYLENARTQFASGGQYSAIFATVESILNEFGNRTDYTAYENAQLEIDTRIEEINREALAELGSLDHNVATLEATLNTMFEGTLSSLQNITEAQQEQINALIGQLEMLRGELAEQNKAVIDSQNENGDKVAKTHAPITMAAQNWTR